ncbi:MAG: cyclic pyranopterin monophosphate synthase MoaC [Actinomycetota bacterium]|nr:cyclic pyranopterin monophosphate synthase MoaC [Actinomycetota bacterium]
MPEYGRLTHLDEHGRAQMVDVSAKAATARRAVAACRLVMEPDTAAALIAGKLPKGNDVLAIARVAGVLAAKATPQLIPLCHKVLLGDVAVDFSIGEREVRVEARVAARDRTGVEIEALNACLAAALTVYEGCKALDRSMVIEDLTLLEKSGGRSGSWQRLADGSVRHDVTGGEP